MIRRVAAGIAADAADGGRLVGRILTDCRPGDPRAGLRHDALAAMPDGGAGRAAGHHHGAAARARLGLVGRHQRLHDGAGHRLGVPASAASFASAPPLPDVIVASIVARWLPYNHVALALFLAVSTFLGTVGMVVSPHGMAWLLSTITVNIVLLPASMIRWPCRLSPSTDCRKSRSASSRRRWSRTCSRPAARARRRRRRPAGGVCSTTTGRSCCRACARRSPS